jgi:predicted amidophosphoribosyltransferase
MSPLRRVGRALHRHALAPALAFVLPTACFGCGAALGAVQRLGACAGCWGGLRALAPPLCPTCGLPEPASTDLLGPAGGRCSRCVLRPGALDRVRPAVAYDALARSFLLRAKLGGRSELLVPLGDQLARVLEITGFAEGCDEIVPVPSHPWVTLRRGFVPALELACRCRRDVSTGASPPRARPSGCRHARVACKPRPPSLPAGRSRAPACSSSTTS